jgi:hypothetical protein
MPGGIDSFLKGVQAGQMVSQPYADYQARQQHQDFQKALEELRFKQAIQEMALKDPNIALASQREAGMTTDDGQQSVKPLGFSPDQQAAMNAGKAPREINTMNVGGYNIDPVMQKNLNTQDDLDKVARQLQFHKDIANYQNGLELSKPREVTPGSTVGSYNDIMSGKGFKVADRGTEPKPFTLSAGEKLYSPTGEILAENAKDAADKKPIVVPPGSTVIGADGNTIFTNAAAAKPVKMATSDEKFVDTLSTKNANKISIANQLEEGFKTLSSPTIPENEKVKEGQRLLKVLNSSEGQDAVGVDESRRLGSMLEYNFGGIGGIQAKLSGTGAYIGRDLPGFTGQLKNAVSSIRKSAQQNQVEIDKVNARYGVAPQATVESDKQPSPEVDLSKYEGAPHFSNEQAAHKAGLKDNTPILINGRPAIYHP